MTGCTKMRWETPELADGHRLLLLNTQPKRRPDPTRLHVYQCPYCEGWHVGHASQPVNAERES